MSKALMYAGIGAFSAIGHRMLIGYGEGGGDTSTYRKARKERARMLSMARQEELKNNPKPPKKRGRKKK